MSGSSNNGVIRIGRKGIKGRPFLKQALQQARGQIQTFLSDAAREIEARWKA